MPESKMYSIVRKPGLVRHEVFFGTANRKKSIQYGLVVFLPTELHNGSDKGVHFNREFDTLLKKIGQAQAMTYYGWDIDDFIREFGKNYL